MTIGANSQPGANGAAQERLPLRAAYSFLESNGLAAQSSEIQASNLRWKSYNSTVKRGLVVELLKNKNLLERFLDESWSLGRTEKGIRETARYLRILQNARGPEPERPEDEEGEGNEFATEEDLRDFLSENLGILEQGLTLWPVKDGAAAVEYQVGENRRIDILARDKSGLPVIIELKVSRGHERTIGQALYYRARLKEMLGTIQVRIIIVAREIGPELRAAAREVSDVALFNYSISMKVAKVIP